MSRREYDDYGRDSKAVEYIPARPRSRAGSSYAPPGGYPDSPNDSYPRTYNGPVSMPAAPAPPDDAYGKSSTTIVSGRRPPSPGVRFADEHRDASRDNPARRSAGGTDWKRVYERELAEQRELEKRRESAGSRGAVASPDRGPTARGLDVNLNTDRIKGSLSLSSKSEKKKEKRDNDLAWSSEDSEDEKQRQRQRDRRKEEKDRERDLREREKREEELERIKKERDRIEKEKAAAAERRRSSHYADGYGDPRRSSGQLQDPRRSSGALQLVNDREREIAIERERERIREREKIERLERERIAERDRMEREKAERRRSGHYEDAYHGDPRRSAGQLHDPRRSAGSLAMPSGAGPARSAYGDDPRRSAGHIVRYEHRDTREDYRRESPPSGEIAGVRYVQRPLSPVSSGRPSSRPPQTHYLITEQPNSRQRASSVGHRHASVPSIDTGMSRMTVHDRDYHDHYEHERYDDYPPDAYRPSYYPLSPMPSPGLPPRDRGFSVDVGGSFALGGSHGGASAGYTFSAGSSRHHRSHSHGHADYVRPEEKLRPQEPDYDPNDHAQILYKALKGKVADVGAILKVIPFLSGDQMVDLRAEYKKVHPLGNVNLAKHLKAQLSGKVQLAAYVTALGPYESESYWSILANQKPNFRHALLIEAIMGREIDDIIDIKQSYRDSKNDHNFEKAIKKELAADKATGEKFKDLVLLQLDTTTRGLHMNEWDKVYLDKVRDDAEDLHDALAKDKVDSFFVGKIVITRSTTHLRELLRMYKKLFDGQDLARLIAEKLNGLIGEALLHVLNGVLNKPARDARLLEESMKGVGTRDDLLVARLVRIHWDPEHLTAVKEAYKSKYGMSLKERIKGECSGSYQEFLLNLISVDTHTTAVVKA
ncbi:hypothetical protein TWF106_005266 [Orbilia oligospora]|uniref:Annexin n=1 Tax=Orbilia oligospora TaxID=2813651 RepID=A0A7C8QQB1_ORBOL|nr:hypothetical protein TWF106_005266 [Orbilia oligospora]